MLELINQKLERLNTDLTKVESELAKVEQLKRIKYELTIQMSVLESLVNDFNESQNDNHRPLRTEAVEG